MPLSNYSDLQTTITAYLENDDVTGRVVDFITLAEARFNRELRIREMHKLAEIDIDTEEVALPADFLEIIAWRFTFASPDVTAQYLPPDRFFSSVAHSITGPPKIYTILGSSAWFAPNPGSIAPGTYGTSLEYLAKIPPLTTTNTSNFLLAKAPDLYLYGALLEAQPFVMDDERAGIWQGLYDRALTSLRAADTRARYRPGGSMRPYLSPRDGKVWA